MHQVIQRGYELELERQKVKLQEKGLEPEQAPEKEKKLVSKRTLLRGKQQAAFISLVMGDKVAQRKNVVVLTPTKQKSKEEVDKQAAAIYNETNDYTCKQISTLIEKDANNKTMILTASSKSVTFKKDKLSQSTNS